MLTCIACSKQLVDADDDAGAHGGSSKPAVKSLTSQIKDVVLKLSGVYRPPPGPSSSSWKQFHRSYYYDEDDLNSSSFRANGKPTCGQPWPEHHGSGAAAGGKVAAEGDEEEQPKEWVAQVEPGVHITFVSLPEGGNDLKRIRFTREMFNKWQAQRWWGDNYDRVMELYNVQRFNRQALPTPPRSEDERDLSYSRMGSTRDSPVAPPPFPTTVVHPYNSASTNSRPPTASSTTAAAGTPQPDPTDHFFPHHHNAASVDATTTSSRDVSVSNASDLLEVTEWVEQDDPGVFITIRQLPDGTRDLRRVRFSRERFGELNAKLWWEENRDRIHAQYL